MPVEPSVKSTKLVAPGEQVNDGTAGSPSGAQECEIESVKALALVTVSVTVHGPAFEYGWGGGAPSVVYVAPSPKSHDHATASVEASRNDSSWSVPVAEQLNAATGVIGGAVGGGGAADGTTAFEGADGGLVPIGFVAVTVNV